MYICTNIILWNIKMNLNHISATQQLILRWWEFFFFWWTFQQVIKFLMADEKHMRFFDVSKSDVWKSYDVVPILGFKFFFNKGKLTIKTSQAFQFCHCCFLQQQIPTHARKNIRNHEKSWKYKIKFIRNMNNFVFNDIQKWYIYTNQWDTHFS